MKSSSGKSLGGQSKRGHPKNVDTEKTRKMKKLSDVVRDSHKNSNNFPWKKIPWK